MSKLSLFDYGVIDCDDYETYNLLTVWLSADGKKRMNKGGLVRKDGMQAITKSGGFVDVIIGFSLNAIVQKSYASSVSNTHLGLE